MNMVNKYVLILLVIFAGCTVLFSHRSVPTPVITNEEFDMNGGSFPPVIRVIIQSDTNEALKKINAYLDKPIVMADFKNTNGYTFIEQGCPTLIWLSRMSFSAEDIAVANHELLHATIASMRFSGVSFEDASEEAYAYQLQHLSKQFYNNLKIK